MAHAESNKAIIWKVFGILTIITIIEVVLGIYKPKTLYLTHFLGTSLLNILFLTLTLVKAYYIAWYFMHLKWEKKWFRRAIVWLLIMYISLIAFFLLTDGDSARRMMHLLFN